MYYQEFTTFASTYDCNTYGSGSYDQAGNCTTAASGTSGLASTGQDAYIGVGVGVVLIIAAVVMLLRSRKTRKTTSKN